MTSRYLHALKLLALPAFFGACTLVAQADSMRRLTYVSVPTGSLKSVKEKRRADFYSYDLFYGKNGHIRVGCSGDKGLKPPSDTKACTIKVGDELTFGLGKYRKYYHFDRKTNHVKMITFQSTDGREQVCTILILNGSPPQMFKVADAIHPN